MILRRVVSGLAQARRQVAEVGEDAVDAEAHADPALLRLDVDVGGAAAVRLDEDAVDEADHRPVGAAAGERGEVDLLGARPAAARRRARRSAMPSGSISTPSTAMSAAAQLERTRSSAPTFARPRARARRPRRRAAAPRARWRSPPRPPAARWSPVRNWIGSTAKASVGSAIARRSSVACLESGRTLCLTQCERGTRREHVVRHVDARRDRRSSAGRTASPRSRPPASRSSAGARRATSRGGRRSPSGGHWPAPAGPG